MPKRYHNLSLAKSPEQWTDLDKAIHDHVTKLCGRYDDPEQVKSFLLLVDLMTNIDYAFADREMVIWEVKRQAFAPVLLETL